MALHVVLFLLGSLLFLGWALLCRLSWLQLSHSQAGGRHALVHRLLKPRTPLDCPICRLASPGVKPASTPVRPWSEVKSRRGARHPSKHRRLRLSQSAVRVLRVH